MTPEQFAYWLQGFVEITDGVERPSEQQWLVIKDHLKQVFEKRTPTRSAVQMLTENEANND